MVLVIAAMVLVLTFLTKDITRRDRTVLPATVQVQTEGNDFVVTRDGIRSVVRGSDGYTMAEGPDGAHILIRTYTVNRFLNAENLVGVAKEASFIAVMAVGMAGIIIMGGIDLSIGSIYALAGVFGGMALHSLQAAYAQEGGTSPPWLIAVPVGLLVPCLVGAGCGAINGIGTVGLRVHPFIITLGGMAIYRGIAFVITKGQSISEFPDTFTTGLFRASIGGVNPVPLGLMLLVGVAGEFVLRRPVFGRQTFAIGGNEVAARYAGVPVGRNKVVLYTLGGFAAGLSAAMMLGYYGAVSSAAGTGYELDVIAAAVVGGASLSGGRGSALGAMLGAIIIQLINNAITVLEIDENFKQIIIGLAIVIAVVVDQAKNRLSGPGR